MSKQKKYRVKLIQDTPAIKDEFGAHQRLADAIAELIDTQDGGLSIGLEGGWGSGKSTVVNLLKEKLVKKNHHTVILFDAWAHQGDPLRRTFLETLIRHLETLNWIDNEKWENTRAELAQRRKITETKSIPRLGKMGALLAISVLLIPVGLALLNAGLREPPGNPDNWMPFLGILLTLIPVLILLLSLLPRVILWAWKRGHGDSNVVPLPWGDFGALVAQRYVQDTRTETIENPNPTSVEFQETFSNLMEEALAHDNRNIVIALDNLDRVTPGDAISILAALQTFLKYNEHQQPTWFKKLYVLIPYDPTGLRRLWKSQGGDDESRVATAFLDKTFQIRFEVPPLLLSNWRSYLISLLKEALPDHDESEFHATYRVYAIQCNLDNFLPTPRDLKLFVNQIGTINRQWRDAFPLPQVAYYVYLRRNGKNVSEGLLKGTFPSPDVVDLLGENSQDNLAAMSFNVAVRDARQLLLRTPLEAALGAGDAETTKNLSEYPGFWEVLQEVPFNDWSESESIKLTQAAYCLDTASLLASAESSVAIMVTNTLKDAALQVTSWTPLNSSSAQGITALLRLIPDADLARMILYALPPFSIESTPKTSSDLISPWTQGFVSLLKGIQEQGLDVAYSEGVEIALDADGYIELCAQMFKEDADEEFWSVLRPNVSAADVVGKLEVITSSEDFSLRQVNALEVMKHAQLSLSWNEVFGKMILELEGASTISPALIVVRLTALWRLRKVDQAIDSELKRLSVQGHILHHFYNIREDATAAAWCLFIFLQYIPDATAPESIGFSQNGFEYLTTEVFVKPQEHSKLTNEFIGLLQRFNNVPFLFEILDASAASKDWIVACLKAIAVQPSARRLFKPEVLASRWEFLENEFTTDEYEALLRKMIKESDLLSYLSKQNFVPGQASFYTTLVQVIEDEQSEYFAWCVNGLKDIDYARWQTEFKAERSIAELVVDLIDKSVDFSLGNTYEDALAEHGKLVISGKAKPKRLSDYWQRLFIPLSMNGRQILRKKLLNAADIADGKIAAEFFELYGNEIADYTTLQADSEIVIKLFMPLLRERNDVGLAWLERVFATHPDIMNGYDSLHVEGFRERIQVVIDDRQNEASSTIFNIANHLGIQRSELSQEDTAE